MTPNAYEDIQLQGVIGKIRKLLSLAQNNPSEQEAAVAMAKAQEMMAAYNLEMTQLDAAPDPTKKSATDFKRVKEKYERSALFDFQRALWEAVARVNYCYYEAIPVYKTNTLGVRLKANYHHYLIGREANVVMTKIMGEYLEEVITKLCPYKVGKPMFSWKEGCAARLVERLNIKRWELEAQSREASKRAQEAGGTSTALMTMDNVSQTEEDLNYREQWGQDAYERRLATRHNRETCECKYCTRDREFWTRIKEDEKRAVLVPDDAPPAKQETEAQRRKREEREARADKRYWDAQDRKDKAKWAKKDMRAYNQGHAKGSDVGLDPQVRGGGGGNLK